jgi:hypothetical protein
LNLLGRRRRRQIFGEDRRRQGALLGRRELIGRHGSQQHQITLGRTALKALKRRCISNDDRMSDRTGQGAFRAQPRLFEQRLPFRNGSRESWHSQINLEPVAVVQHGGVAADGEGNLGLTTGDIDSNRRARRIGIDRRAIRLLDLKQFHDVTNTLWASAISAA